ncbi:MAG: hypothetical protein ACLGG0_10695 [Bacteriovoracia bacterium]
MKLILFSTLLSLLSPAIAAVTNEQIGIVRSRINSQPKNCGLITSPISTSDQTSINNSVELRAAVLNDMIKNMDSRCLKIITQNLAFKSKTDPVTDEQMKKILAVIDARTEKFPQQDETICYNAPTGIEELLQLAKMAKDVKECRPINPGQSVVVDKSNSPSYLDGEYTLIRTEEKKWTVALALEVNSGNGIAGDEMFNRIKTCMAAANQSMKGPNGEVVDFNILSVSENKKLPMNKRPPVSEISIQPAGARSHSRAYAADITCSTIVHEVLHLLGLCDEYEAKDDGYECRAVPSFDSIMKNHTAIFNQTIPKQLTCECTNDDCHKLLESNNADIIRLKATSWALGPADYKFRNKYCGTAVMKSSIPLDTSKKNFSSPIGDRGFKATLYDIFAHNITKMSPTELTCNCPENDQACMEVRADVLANLPNYTNPYCPAGSREIKTAWGVRGNYVVRENGFTMPGPKPTRSSILEPVHFNRIIGGACDNVTPQYNECSKWAYKGTFDKNDCSGRPAYCTNDDWMK